MSKEYSIACLLNNATSEELFKCISFIEQDNSPHISLFQFKCDDQNFLTSLRKYTNNLIISTKFFIDKISWVESNIYLDIKDDSTLKKSSDQIAEFYFNHCQIKKPLSQIDFTQLNSSDVDLVRKYGIYWIKQNFRPHVTLAYQRKLAGNFNITPPKIIKILPLDIYEIDPVGKIKMQEKPHPLFFSF